MFILFYFFFRMVLYNIVYIPNSGNSYTLIGHYYLFIMLIPYTNGISIKRKACLSWVYDIHEHEVIAHPLLYYISMIHVYVMYPRPYKLLL